MAIAIENFTSQEEIVVDRMNSLYCYKTSIQDFRQAFPDVDIKDLLVDDLDSMKTNDIWEACNRIDDVAIHVIDEERYYDSL